MAIFAGGLVPRVECELLCHSASAHLQQLYTGFSLLHKRRVIDLRIRSCAREIRHESAMPHLRDAGHAHLSAIIDGETRLHFDMHDAAEIAVGELNDCDLYLKRSYATSYISGLPEHQRRKIRPLGLNYRVLPDTIDTRFLQANWAHAYTMKQKLSVLKQALDVRNVFGFQPRARIMESLPQLDAPARVLFMVAAYDPYDAVDRTPEKMAEREFNNEMRARCIGLLKAELGSGFFGGFARNEFVMRRYPGLVLPGDLAIQKNYIRTLRSFPICISTTGLHGSTGWKFAEYIAFAKAIVCEPLHYEVPGHLTAGKHYLEFVSPEQCVAAAVRLVDDRQLRHEMMTNNAAYYESHLRPDVLVSNALEPALERDAISIADAQATSR